MGNRQSASLLARWAFWGLARSLALLALVPAILFNVDWSFASGWPHAAAAVAMVIGSALLVDVALRRPHLVGTPILLAAALVMVYSNTKAALRNLSFVSELASEAREGRMAAGSQLASQRSRLEERRKAQVKLAGEDAAATLELAVDAVRVAEPQRWRLTNGCAPDKVTTSVDFCLRFANAKAKVAAAMERDRIDGELARLASLATGVAEAVPKVADAYVANVISLLGEAGLKVTERLVAAEEAMVRALSLELLAAFGPFAWLQLLDGADHVSERSRFSTMAKKSKVADAPPAEPAKADEIDRWIANMLEVHPGAVLTPAEMRQTPGWPAAKKGEENAVFQRIKKLPGVKHHPNNGRPRYYGLRLKTKGPVLAAVDGTRV